MDRVDVSQEDYGDYLSQSEEKSAKPDARNERATSVHKLR